MQELFLYRNLRISENIPEKKGVIASAVPVGILKRRKAVNVKPRIQE
jgi:hypothetical protein